MREAAGASARSYKDAGCYDGLLSVSKCGGLNGAALNIGILGGTGPEGRGLAVRFAVAGHNVAIGSRDEDRAAQVAGEVSASIGDPGARDRISGTSNVEAAHSGEVVIVAVPYAGMEDTLQLAKRYLSNKVCLSVISPIEVVGGTARLLEISAGSAAEEAERIIPDANWVAGFHTVPAHDLMRPTAPMQTDCLLCSDDGDALATVSELVEDIPGLRPVNCGRLENSRYLEGMTALLINTNRIHKAHGSIRIEGI